MQNQQPDILERLKHPEEEVKRQQMQKHLFLRNMLNLLFMLMALGTMGCISYFLYTEGDTPMWCYLLGIVAVIIKMCESMLRMPWLNRSNGIRSHRRHQSQN